MPVSPIRKQDLIGQAIQNAFTQFGQSVGKGYQEGREQTEQEGIVQNLLNRQAENPSLPLFAEPNVKMMQGLSDRNVNIIKSLADYRAEQDRLNRPKTDIVGNPEQGFSKTQIAPDGTAHVETLTEGKPKAKSNYLRTETIKQNGVTKMVDIYGHQEDGKEVIDDRKYQDFTPSVSSLESINPNLDLMTGDEILESLPKGERALIQSILDYRVDPSKVTSLRRGERKKIMEYVTAVDPTFDMTQYNARYRTRQDFTSGKAAVNMRGLNTAVGHLGTLANAGKALENAGAPMWNAIANFGLEQTGDPRVTRFNVAANAVESELASVFKGMGATDQEIKAWREQLSSSHSPEQIKAAVDQAVELLGSRLQALTSQFESGTGKPKDFKILNDASRKVLSDLGIDVSSIDPIPGEKSGGAQKIGNYTVEIIP